MATFFDSIAGSGLLAPEQIGPLITEPLEKASTALQISTVLTTSSREYRFPKVTGRPTASWVAESGAIPESIPEVDEVVAVGRKLGVITPITNEMRKDSIGGGALDQVSHDVISQLQRQIDIGYFGSAGGNPNRAPGLLDLTGYQTISVGAFVDFGWAIRAESLLNQVGATATAFVANASTVETLALLRRFQDTATVKSNEFLLASDPTQRTKWAVNGTPIWAVPDDTIADGVIWALCGSDAPIPKAFVVHHGEPELEISNGPYFFNDALALRVTYRVSFAWPHAAAVVKIVGTLPGS